MTTYYILDVTRGTLVLNPLGGFITSDGLTEAINSAESLEKVHERSFCHVTASEYTESVARDKNRLNFVSANYETLKQQVEDFLRDGIDGSLDADSFIEDHEDLIDAVGFDLTEERTFEVTLTCTARVKRGVDLTEIHLEASLDTWGDSGVTDIEVDGVYVSDQ